MAESSVILLHGDSMSIITLLLLMLILIQTCSAKCGESSCGSGEPHVRFPFQLINGTKDECFYPGFCLYCSEKKETILFLSSIKLRVRYINYNNHEIILRDPENCLPKKFLQINNSLIHPYKFENEAETSNLNFFDCSSIERKHLRSTSNSQDMLLCPIYVSNPDKSVLSLDLTSCTKMFDIITPVSAYRMHVNLLKLRWPEANCSECEAKGKKCKWKNNRGDTECYECQGKTIHVPPSFIFSVTGSILLGVVIIVVFKIKHYFRKKEEDQARVEKFLGDYRAEKPTRFTYTDVKRITSGFKEKLGEGSHGAVFKGKLSNEIVVAVKILNNTGGDGDGKEFINEVGIMGKIHHINVVRLLGFCAEGLHRALVYNFFPNGSLQSFIFSPDDKDNFLGWEKLQHIALGIAKGIEYLHQGCSNHPIIHFDINPHNVLLDDNFTPKISDFGLAKLCSKNPSLVTMTAARGTLGYIAPEVFSRNFGNVSYKSDIYSYGMLLLEMVGGRKNVDISSPQNFHVLYPDWIHDLVQGDVHIHVEEEGDVKIAKKLAIVGLWCIQWQPVNRPSIKYVIKMLESKEEEQLTVPPNSFHSTTTTISSGITSTRRPLELEVIEE